MLKIFAQDVVLQEAPGEVSLAFAVHGCPCNCPNCSWKSDPGYNNPVQLTLETYTDILEQHKGLATCVLFLGGEWEDELEEYLMVARDMGYKTCLYTGLDSVGGNLPECLDYLKTGPYVEELGGLDSPETNQRYVRLEDGEDLTHLFQ